MEKTVNAIQNFIKGFNREFLSLEESLCHPNAERQLLDLRGHDIGHTWDPSLKQYIVSYKKDGQTQTLFIPKQFNQYIRQYGVEFITDNGTPWLSREQKQIGIPDAQSKDYYKALAEGENREIVLINWSNTDLRRGETGHSSLSVGTLDLADGYTETDKVPIYEYTPEISGSFYPSIAPVMRRAPDYVKHHTDAAKARHGDHPVAHSLGVTARDAILPVSAAVGSGVAMYVAARMSGLIKDKQEGKKVNVDAALKSIGLVLIAHAAGKKAGQFKTSTGAVMLKEEEKGAGVLATLVTPAQMDLMEHALYGMYRTYHEKYNLLSSNCADFSDKMMQEIGLDTRKILDEAVAEDKAEERNIPQKVRARAKTPEHIRPSRLSWAYRNRKPETATVKVDGQPVSVSRLDVDGQSTVLIESSKFKFEKPPIETFQTVLKDVLTLEKSPNGTYAFDFQPGITRVAGAQAASRGAGPTK